MFADEGDFTDAGVVTGTAENVSADGVATGSDTEQIATATGDESWDSLIKGKYKDDYNRAVKDAVAKRFKNQRDLQGQIDSINPMVQELARRYGVAPDSNGRIDLNALQAKVFDDDSMYEQEAFQRGMSVDDLKQMKSLERENERLKAQTRQSQADREWQETLQEASRLREIYPNFDFDREMDSPEFGRLLASMKKMGMADPMKTAYEIVHKDEIMSGAMRYGVQKAQEKLTNAIQANQSRPVENGVSQVSTARIGEIDPSKLTKAQIDDLKRRAERGERITFS